MLESTLLPLALAGHLIVVNDLEVHVTAQHARRNKIAQKQVQLLQKQVQLRMQVRKGVFCPVRRFG